MNAPSTILIVLAFPLLFGAIWCFVLWIISKISGWSRLAVEYKCREPFEGKLLRFQSARVGQAKLNGVLNLGLSESGLYLVLIPLFKMFHDPLLIPWREIHASPHTLWFMKYTRLTFDAVPGVTLDLPQKTFDRLVADLKVIAGKDFPLGQDESPEAS